MPPTTESLEMLTIGSRVFYSGHGVVSVLTREVRTFAGDEQAYFVLELELEPGAKPSPSGAKFLIPVAKVKTAGFRELVSAAKAKALLKLVADQSEPAAAVKTDPTSRKLRATSYAEGLRSGSPDRYTEILRELIARFRSSKLSASEQQTLQQALAMFVGEVSAALGVTRDEVRADLLRLADLPTAGW